jgi:hypothetical protein
VQNFRTVVRVAEILSKYPIENVNVILPDALKNKLPPVPGLVFLKSTDTGSFADKDELVMALDKADYNLIVGDFSKNAITARAVTDAYEKTKRPLLITRDAVDLIADNQPERVLLNQQIVLMASMVQLQKLLKAVYYPKMLLLSAPLVQIAEILHKFTLSYPVAIITLHSDQVLVAWAGNVSAVPIEKTGYSPLTIWGGELAVKIVANNLFNPNNFMDATVSSLF